jgi:hypothetical protein
MNSNKRLAVPSRYSVATSTTKQIESVFDRLHRKQTAASIGQRTTPCRLNHTKKANNNVRRRLQKARISMLNELLQEFEDYDNNNHNNNHNNNKEEEASSTTDLVVCTHCKTPNNINEETEEEWKSDTTQNKSPLSSSSILSDPSSTLEETTKTSHRPATGKENIDHRVIVEPEVYVNQKESVFERLYRMETKASVGQQHQIFSTRRKMMRTSTTKEWRYDKKRALEKNNVVSATKTNIEETSACTHSLLLDSLLMDDSDDEDYNSNIDFMMDDINNTPERIVHSTATVGKDVVNNATSSLSHGTPETVHSSFDDRDDNSVSTVSSIVQNCLDAPSTPDSRSSIYSGASGSGNVMKDICLESLYLPLTSEVYRAPWKMAVCHNDETETYQHAGPLYLRSMSNVLYEFSVGRASEMDVAAELITALFHRDCTCTKYSGEDIARVKKVGSGSEYDVQKSAQGWATRGNSQTARSSGIVRFDYAKRMLVVQDYVYSVESS